MKTDQLTIDPRKPTNPKDAIGTLKPRFWSGISWHVLREVSIAFLEGAFKYGRHNYRPAGVRGSVYYDAALDHLTKWWEGEDFDMDTLVEAPDGSTYALPHITKAICCLIVLRDSQITGNWVDDRPPINAGSEQLEYLKIIADGLRKKYPKPEAPYIQNGRFAETEPKE